MLLIKSSAFELFLSPLLLLITALLLVFWCYRYYIAPYAKIPSHVWMLDSEVIRRTFLNGSPDTPANSFLFQKFIKICKPHMSEGMCVLWMFEPIVLVFGEKAAKVLSNESSATDKPWMYQLVNFVVRDGLFSSNGKKWKKQKKMIGPAFYNSALKGTVPIINNHAVTLVHKLTNLKGRTTGESANLLEELSLKVFLESSLGIKDDTENNLKQLCNKLSKIMEFIAYRMCSPWMYWDFMLKFSPFARETVKIVNDVHQHVEKVLQDLQKSVNSAEIDSKLLQPDEEIKEPVRSVGHILMKQYLSDSSFTMENLRDHIITLIIAGYDTTSTALHWCLFMLGLHDDIQQRLYDEVISETDECVQFEDLRKLKYMECVIKETLRLFPVSPIFSRLLTKDVQCGQYKIPKNTTITFVPFLLHRDPEIYPDPETFNPDRFLEKDSKINQWTFTPFAEGTRSCIGKNFAMMEMKIVIAHVLRNFKVISLDRREDIVFTWELVLKTANHFRLQFIPRQRQQLKQKKG